jgi:hypothetical protein
MEGRKALSLLIDRPDLKSIMTNTSQPTLSAKTADTISIRQRLGIWRVALNGKFYGDYTRRYWAIEAAFEKADAIAAKGGAATITIARDGAQDALLYDTRAPAPRRQHTQGRAMAESAPLAAAGRRDLRQTAA